MNLENILKYGVLIGSRAYGVAREDSDYDIVLTEDDYYKVCEKDDMVSCKNIETSETNADGYDYSIFGEGLDDIGRFKSDDGFDINVFLYTDPIGDVEFRITQVKEMHIYDRFKLHNELMLKSNKSLLENKEDRVKIFIENLAEAGIMERE